MIIDPSDNSLMFPCGSASCFSYTFTVSSRTCHRDSSVWLFVPESPLRFFLFLITRSLRSTWPRGGWHQWVTWQSSIPEIGKRSARTMWRFRQRIKWVKSLLGSSLPFPTFKGIGLDSSSILRDCCWVCQLAPKGMEWLEHSEGSWSTVL